MEERFKRKVSELSSVVSFIDDFIGRKKLDEATALALHLAIEEIFINMVRHGRGGADSISIELNMSANGVEMVLTDFDVDEFDPTSPEIDLEGVPLNQRRAGGMGLFMVRQLVDDMRYEYKDRISRVMLTKSLGDSRV